MSEEVKGAEAPAEGVVTPISEIVDKPRHTDQAPAPDPRREKPKAEKPDEDARFRGLLNETLSEREKRQAVERERDQYKRAWEEHQRKLATEQEKDPAPDMFKDPNAYNAWIDRQLNKRAEDIARQHVQPIMSQVSDANLRLSEMQAEKNLGPERFGKLNEWIKAQGEQFGAWALSQPDPYWAAYQQYRQRTTFERLGDDDLETYEQKLRAKILAEMQGPIDAADDDIEDPPPQRQRAPQSFANSRSAAPERDTGGRFTGPRPLGELVREKDQKRKR